MTNSSDRVSQLSPVKRALLAVEQMQSRLDAVERARTEPIAVVGMACRFPGGANSPAAFWRLLREGVDAITEVPADRWDIEAYFDPDPATPGKMYTRWGGFIEGVDKFDAGFFGISPREALSVDPQQRMLLEVAWEALEDAGQSRERVSGSKTGVFVGLMNNEYFQLIKRGGFEAIDAYYGTGNVMSSAAGRISYTFGLQGPSMTVDTACSASLVTTHLACRSLRGRECDMALAGGANLILVPDVNVYMSRARTMAADGRCKTFDASADGYVRGEGCGVVVLKRLSDAIADGDDILALIRGSAVKHDGRGGGYTVPNGGVQQEVIREALTNAGVEPSAVGYVEAHGTGTSLGDPIEMRALGAVLKHEGRRERLAVGSVKTNIGHLESAAGIAGLIKAVLALRHGEIPPHLHLKEVNPQIPLDELGFNIPTSVTPWRPDPSRKRFAGVSSFGLTGTIAHVVLEEAAGDLEAVSAARAQDSGGDEPRPQLLTLSARDPQALEALAELYREYLDGEGARESLSDICYTAGARRTHHEHRLALAGRTHAELSERLEAFRRGDALPEGDAWRRPAIQAPKTVFVFPGQGSQWAGMGRRLLRMEPAFRASMERCDALIREHNGWSLLEELTAESGRSRLEEIDVVQPALFAVQVSLAALWRAWGIEPAAVIGQSMGEIAAAHVAGALSLEDAVMIICRRSRLLKSRSGMGGMAAVELSLEQTRDALADYADRLSVAVSNSPTSTVVAGQTAALEELLESLERRGVSCRRVKVDIASHSPQMEPLREPLLQSLEEVRPRALALPFYSTVTGEFSRELTLDAGYWWRNLREPVLFSGTVRLLLESGYRNFIEVSPHPIVLTSIQQGMYHLGVEGTALPSLRRDEDERAVMLGSLGSLYAFGHDVNWKGLFHEGGRCVHPPTYPWRRERFWVEAGESANAAAESFHTPTYPWRQRPLLGAHISPASPSLNHLWEFKVSLRRLPFLKEHRVQGMVVVPATAYVEMALEAAAEVFGERASLTALKFDKALFVPEDAALTMQLGFSLPVEGGVGFHVYSRPDADGDEERHWTLHTTGQIRFDTEEPDGPPGAALEAIRERCRDELTGDDFYGLLSDAGHGYGPSFQSIRTLWRRDTEAVAQLVVSDDLAAEAAPYRFHPAILDCCLQLLGATLSQNEAAAAKGAYVPVAIDEVRVKGRPNGRMWGHASLRVGGEGTPDESNNLKGDVSLRDEAGRVLIELAGVELQCLEERSARSSAGRVAEWMYEPVWEEQGRAEKSTEGRRAHTGGGAWLIFSDRQGVGAALAEMLEADGEKVLTVETGAEFARVDGRTFLASPTRPEDLREIYRSAGGPGCKGIVHLWSLDAPDFSVLTHDTLKKEALDVCVGVLNLMQAVAQTGAGAQPRVWLVSQGARAVRDERRIAVTQSPLWGLGRTIAQELPQLFGGLIDLEGGTDASQSARLLRDELSAPTEEQQIAFRQDRRYVWRLVRRPERQRAERAIKFRADSSYLITGGLGALGLQVARWMVEQGARRLILMGRTPLPIRSVWSEVQPDSPFAGQIDTIRQLEAMGASVHLAPVDVADEAQLVSFLDAFEREGWPRIRGVIHAAGTLNDRTLFQHDADTFSSTWGPKVVGSWLLHHLLPKDSLDFFILFSSVASLLGSPGQANYAAANSFMDALSSERKAQGLPALSINWGAWSEVGLAAQAERGGRLAQRGFRSIAPAEGIEALSQLFKQDSAQVGVVPIDWKLVQQFTPEVAALPLFSRVRVVEEERPTADGRPAGLTRDLLLSAEPPARAQLLADYLREAASRILGLRQTALDPRRPLNAMGLDSLMAIELKNSIQTKLGVVLPVAVIVGGPSIAELVAQILELLNEQTRDGSAPVSPEPLAKRSLGAEEAEQLLTGLDELSPEQIDLLLAEMLDDGR